MEYHDELLANTVHIILFVEIIKMAIVANIIIVIQLLKFLHSESLIAN